MLAGGWLLVDKPPRAAVPDLPERIVSLGPALTESLYALGAGGLLVGRTRYCDYPKEAASVPIIGGYVDIDVEMVLMQRPDMVVVSPGPGSLEAVRRIRDAGVRVEVLASGSVREILASLTRLGDLLGRAAAAGALVGRLRGQLTDVAERAARRPRVTCLMVIQHEPLVLAAAGSFPDELLSIAGGLNLAPASASGYLEADIEWLALHPPQVLIDVSAAHLAHAADEAAVEARYMRIPGWRGKVRIAVAKDDAVYLPGPRLAEGAGMLFDMLHDINSS